MLFHDYGDNDQEVSSDVAACEEEEAGDRTEEAAAARPWSGEARETPLAGALENDDWDGNSFYPSDRTPDPEILDPRTTVSSHSFFSSSEWSSKPGP